MKSWLFEKISNVNDPLAQLAKRRGETIKVHKIIDKEEILLQTPIKFGKS